MPTNFNFKELETKNVDAKYRNYAMKNLFICLNN